MVKECRLLENDNRIIVDNGRISISIPKLKDGVILVNNENIVSNKMFSDNTTYELDLGTILPKLDGITKINIMLETETIHITYKDRENVYTYTELVTTYNLLLSKEVVCVILKSITDILEDTMLALDLVVRMYTSDKRYEVCIDNNSLYIHKIKSIKDTNK